MLPRKGRPHRQTLKALTDPQPEFVSMVFGGANKTPFRAIRADGAAVGEQDEQAVKAETHAIARVEFTGEKFADEAAVKSWLEAGGYDPALAVTKTDTGFMVDSSLDPETVLNVIDLTDTQGVKVYAVAIKSDDILELKREQELHPGASPAMVQKYCDVMSCCDSCSSDGKTIAEVIADRPDAVPPGLMDLHWALYDAIRNCLRDGDMAGAKAALNEFGNMMDALMRMFPKESTDAYRAIIDAIAPEIHVEKEDGMSTEQTNEVVTETVEADAAVETAEKTEAVETVEAEAKTDEEVAEVAADAVVEKTDEKIDEPEAVVEKSEEDSGEAAAEVAETPDAVATLTALVTELTTTVKSMQETVETQHKEMVQRVAAVEETRQTRKGADVDETSTASVTATVSDEVSDLRRRSMLGMRRPVSK